MIEVVSAVIVRAGRILLTQRREDKDFPFTWEAPGGKVEGNESHHDALKREIGEELGVDVRAIANDAIWSGEFNDERVREDRRHVFVLMYPLELAYTAMPREGQGIGWFTAAETSGLSLAPANVEARGAIADYMKRCLWLAEKCTCGEARGRHLGYCLRPVPCERFTPEVRSEP